MIHTRQKLATSERRTCRVIGLARSSLQYRPARRDDDALRLALIRLAKQYGRYGYRKIAELLRIEGWKVNHKKVERIWREEGLQLPQRHKKRRRLYHKDASIIRLRPTHPNHVWSIDFVHDKLDSGRSYKMLTVLDEYTRQALAVAVRTRMGAEDVLEALYPLLMRHGTPEYIRSDNGPEFVAEAMQDWLARVGIKPIRIYPGSPWENGYNERFNGTLRREVLNAEWFTTTKQAQIVINQWLRQYNHIRPHQALNMRPPVPETLIRNGPEHGGYWLGEDDIDYLVTNFEAGGFRGPLNRYRNARRDYDNLPQMNATPLRQPSCFIGGSRDALRHFVPGHDLYENVGRHCNDQRISRILEGVGHWVQQEAPEEVTAALLSFLETLD